MRKRNDRLREFLFPQIFCFCKHRKLLFLQISLSSFGFLITERERD